MTIERLKSYGDVCANLKGVEDDLKGVETIDAVQTASKFPYSKHTVPVIGCPPDEDIKYLRREQAYLKREKAEIESYINGIENYKTRKMFEMKFFQGKTYLQIAMKLSSGSVTEDCIEKRIKRYIKKH